MQERQRWVDYAKASGIALVVYGHVARGLHSAGIAVDAEMFRLVDSIIYSFHMPLFFFLSGLFFQGSLVSRGAPGLVLNKIDTIVYPYVLWSLLQGGVEVLLSRYTNGGTSLSDVLVLLWAPRAQFWFLYVLFFVFLICTLVYARARREWLILPLLVFAGIYLAANSVTSDWVFGQLASTTVFFSFGIWFNEVKTAFRRHSTWLAPTLGILFVAGQCVFHIVFGLNYEAGGWPVLMLGLLSILFVTACCMCLDQLKVRWLLALGSASMSIYLMHILAGSGIRIVLSKFLGIDSVALHLLLGTLVGLVAPLLADAVIRRHGFGFLFVAPSWMSAERLLPRTALNGVRRA